MDRIESLLANATFLENLAKALVTDWNLADDLVQETWVAALQSPPKDQRADRAWLARVLRNAVITVKRRRATRSRREETASRRETLPSAEDLAEKVSEARKVLDAVFRLEEPYRSTILYRYYEDRSPQQIAEVERISIETVRTRLKRARGQLREDLKTRHGKHQALQGIGLVAGLTGSGHAADASAAASTGSGMLAHTSMAKGLVAGGLLMSTKTVVTVAILAGIGLGALALREWRTPPPEPITVPNDPIVSSEALIQPEVESRKNESSVAADLRDTGEDDTGHDDIQALLNDYRELAARSVRDKTVQAEAQRVLQQLAALSPPHVAQEALLDAVAQHEPADSDFRTLCGTSAASLVGLWEKEPRLRADALQEFEQTDHPALQRILGSAILQDRESFSEPENSYARVIKGTSHSMAFGELLGNVMNFGNVEVTRDLINFAMASGGPEGEFPWSVVTCYDGWYTILNSQGHGVEIREDMARDLSELASRPEIPPHHREQILRVLEKHGFSDTLSRLRRD